MPEHQLRFEQRATYYVILSAAAATLLGLLFVLISLAAERGRTRPALRSPYTHGDLFQQRAADERIVLGWREAHSFAATLKPQWLPPWSDTTAPTSPSCCERGGAYDRSGVNRVALALLDAVAHLI